MSDNHPGCIIDRLHQLESALRKIATPNTNGITSKEDAMMIALDALDPENANHNNKPGEVKT